MTDQGPGSAPVQPGDEEGAAGPDTPAPNPFSRESSAAGAHSLDAGDQHASGGPAGPAAADPYGYPPEPGAGPGADQGGYSPYGPYDPSSEGDPGRGYGQNRYPSAPPEPDPSQPYSHPSPQPQGPPGVPSAADPSRPYAPPPVAGYGQPGVPGVGDPPAPSDPLAADYGSSYGPGQGYEVSPYQGTYGGYAAYGVPPVQHPQAVAALVTGLLGIVPFPFVGIAAVVLGNKARREIDADPQRYTGRGMATAGFVLGIVGTVITLLLVLGVVGLVALLRSSS